MTANKYSPYSATLTSGYVSGGASKLCAAAEQMFPGLDVSLDGNEDQPSGLVVSVEGGNAKTREENTLMVGIKARKVLLMLKQLATTWFVIDY